MALDTTFNDLITLVESKMSKLPPNGGDVTLWELDSRWDNQENLDLIRNYLDSYGYKVQYSNSDVYRLMLARPKEVKKNGS